MMTHSRSKSLSDNLVLEDVGKGGVIVKSIRPDSYTKTGLKEGDEIVGATIHFDKLKKDEVLTVLELIEPYHENMKVLTKQDIKADLSSWTINKHIASPKEMLKDSYSKLFHRKVQRYLNKEPCDAKASGLKIGNLNGQLLIPEARLHLDGASFKDNIVGPTPNLFNTSAQTPEFSERDPMGLSSKTTDMGDIVKCPKVNLIGPKSKPLDMDLNLKMNYFKRGDTDVSGIDMFNDIEFPELDLKPQVNIEGNLQTPDLNLSTPMLKANIDDPELVVDLPKTDFNIPKPDMRTPDLDIAAPSGKFNIPEFNLSGPKFKGPDFDIDMDSKTPEQNPNVPKLKGGMKTPEVDVGLPSGDMKDPKFDFKMPNIDQKSPSKFKFPKLPKFSGPEVECPQIDIDGDLHAPDLNLSELRLKGNMDSPEFGVDLPKADFNIPKLDKKTPDLDIAAPLGKFNLPKFNLSGPKFKGPDFNVDGGFKKTELNLTAPKIQGEMSPELDVGFPSGNIKDPKFDFKRPSQKFKFPKLPQFSGPEVKSPQVKLDGALQTPDLNLSTPMLKGEMNAPGFGVDLPKTDFNIPKLDMKTQDLDITAPSRKFNMPKLNLSGPKFKGPDFNVDGGFKKPELNLTAPKIKGETFPKLPKFSGPEVKGPQVKFNGALQTPDLNLSPPKLKGKMNAPEFDVDLPKADFNVTKLNMKTQNLDIAPPSEKFNKPKINLSGPKFKGPDFDVNGDFRTPELNLSALKVKGGMKTRELGMSLPSDDMKGPKSDVKIPNIDLKSPSQQFEIPELPKLELSRPKVKGPLVNIDGDQQEPGLNLSAPKINGEINDSELGVDLPKAYFYSPQRDLKTYLDLDSLILLTPL